MNSIDYAYIYNTYLMHNMNLILKHGAWSFKTIEELSSIEDRRDDQTEFVNAEALGADILMNGMYMPFFTEGNFVLEGVHRYQALKQALSKPSTFKVLCIDMDRELTREPTTFRFYVPGPLDTFMLVTGRLSNLIDSVLLLDQGILKASRFEMDEQPTTKRIYTSEKALHTHMKYI